MVTSYRSRCQDVSGRTLYRIPWEQSLCRKTTKASKESEGQAAGHGAGHRSSLRKPGGLWDLGSWQMDGAQSTSRSTRPVPQFNTSREMAWDFLLGGVACTWGKSIRGVRWQSNLRKFLGSPSYIQLELVSLACNVYPVGVNRWWSRCSRSALHSRQMGSMSVSMPSLFTSTTGLTSPSLNPLAQFNKLEAIQEVSNKQIFFLTKDFGENQTIFHKYMMVLVCQYKKTST